MTTCTTLDGSPCTEHRHCPGCKVKHLDHAHPVRCPSCVGQVRWLIREIVDLVVEAHIQHERRAITSDVVMVAGPAASYERSTYLHQSATSGRLCKCRTRGHDVCVTELFPDVLCPDAAFVLNEHRDDTLHPSTVLQDWNLTWRRALDHDLEPTAKSNDARDNLTPKLGDLASYLLTQLTYMAQKPEGAIADMTEDLKACHGWLQHITNNGTAPTVKGEPCPACRVGRLERRTDDQWACPNAGCARVWTDAEYMTRVTGAYIAASVALPATDLAVRLGVPVGTVRRWAGRRKQERAGKVTYLPPLLKSTGRDLVGRKVYDVAEATAIRDSLQLRDSADTPC